MTDSVFYPRALIERAHRNIETHAWARAAADDIVSRAAPWAALSDDELWSLPFSASLPRSWMVWSNGHCPACGEDVPMYNWRINAIDDPWKLACPHCSQRFPTNDFEAYRRSGIDRHGEFDASLADQALLCNTDHPYPDDPQHTFGVDDGNGYTRDGNRWLFIATYLIYGQWKQRIVDGICSLAAAYVVTGDAAYAHRTGVLLDRVADLYPTYHFGRQGILYEKKAKTGYVSTWHDACEEARRLALAYDQVRPALLEDRALSEFSTTKAQRHQLRFDKASPVRVARHIERRILRDTIRHADRIASNFPRQETALFVARAVLGGIDDPDAQKLLEETLTQVCAVDGVTGEKGLANYAAIVLQTLGWILGSIARVSPGALDAIFERHPGLRRTYRFHIDTRCIDRYYPQSGDTGWFGKLWPDYPAAVFSRELSLEPSDFTFFHDLYERTGDPDFVRVLYHANGDITEGLPHDLFADNPAEINQAIQDVITQLGSRAEPRSMDFTEWHLAILRSGRGERARAAWMDYDTGGRHGHSDGLNIGLYARGLDLAPDFGYPPVHMGGWSGALFDWYKCTAAHNTVVVDGRNQVIGISGKTTLWSSGSHHRAIRVTAPELYGIERYERTLLSVDIDEDDAYVVDVFRVVGGRDHARFFHSTFGEVTTSGLRLEPSGEYGHGTQMRAFHTDYEPDPGWQVTWRVADRHGANTPPRDVRLRHTDLTTGAEAAIAEAWIALGFHSNDTEWVPRVLTRRRSAGSDDLVSNFVAVLDPHEKTPRISGIRRLTPTRSRPSAHADSHVALQITFGDGSRDIVLIADPDLPLSLSAGPLASTADLAIARFAPGGGLARVIVHKGDASVSGRQYTARSARPLEVDF